MLTCLLRLTGGLRKALDWMRRAITRRWKLSPEVSFGALPDAPYVTAALELDVSRLKLTTTLPSKTHNVAKTREFSGADAKVTLRPCCGPPARCSRFRRIAISPRSGVTPQTCSTKGSTPRWWRPRAS